MFFVNRSNYEGTPVTIYRSPEDITRDLYNIKDKIRIANESLNIRDTLTEIAARAYESDADKWISDLRYIVNDAEDTLEQLTSLKKQLEELTLELEETLWIIGKEM